MSELINFDPFFFFLKIETYGAVRVIEFEGNMVNVFRHRVPGPSNLSIAALIIVIL